MSDPFVKHCSLWSGTQYSYSLELQGLQRGEGSRVLGEHCGNQGGFTKRCSFRQTRDHVRQNDARAECVQDYESGVARGRWGWCGRLGPSCSPVGHAEEFWLCSASNRELKSGISGLWRDQTCYFRPACQQMVNYRGRDQKQWDLLGDLLFTIWLGDDEAWTKKGQWGNRRVQLAGGSSFQENL